jgi:hypothetical protein
MKYSHWIPVVGVAPGFVLDIVQDIRGVNDQVGRTN